MNRMTKRWLWGLLAFVLLLSSCTNPTINATTQEVREYPLSSVRDFKGSSIKGPQNVNIQDYRLKMSGLVARPRDYTYDEILDTYKAYTRVATMNCVEGWSVTLLWEGIRIKDLLDEAVMKREAKIVIFHSVDGYTTSLPLEYINDGDTLLAYRMNGISIPPEHGFPFMVVAENKWGYKWAKWVSKIEISDNESYSGFWESRGYSNTGNYPDPFGSPE